MPTTVKPSSTNYDFPQAAKHVLQVLRRDRDREIIVQRFGFGLPKRQTLEKIGRQFGITRERVRQIEKVAIKRLGASEDRELAAIDQLLTEVLETYGGVAPIEDIAATLDITPSDAAYLIFFALLVPN